MVRLQNDIQRVKEHTSELESRLEDLEITLKNLIQAMKMANTNQLALKQSAEQSPEQAAQTFMSREKQEIPPAESDMEGLRSAWSYFVAQKGGYDGVLYMTVQDFLNFEAHPVDFLAFLLEKRDNEVQETLEHLQTEYQKLQGSELQQHFRELWELHHNLLKKKIMRSWKEEIFLEAFDAFLSWLQKQ